MNTNELPHGYRTIAEAPLYAINLSATVICIETGRPATRNAEGGVRLTVDGKQIRRSVNALRARVFPAELLAAATHPGEEWRTCRDFPDYKVSTLARVWSVKKAILLAPCGGTTGYPSVCLPLAGGFPSVPVHILVAEAFLGPCPEGMHVQHIDRDRANSRLSNLRHVSAHAPKFDQAAAVALYLSGASGKATAGALGCEKTTVYRALRAKGLKGPEYRPAKATSAQSET
ncbi:HNH endonuclease signature motif containing protein [Rhizobium aegyptiacum]|uniref:HNH endonuclease signature motif containing protein n=1 Tax=Rhizobium aegyptiacum TaxID=1764550 RepID=UPI0007E5B2C7|nr:HNH endonuclease signature motif containing protein [Rhizobium aegyptiacum]